MKSLSNKNVGVWTVRGSVTVAALVVAAAFMTPWDVSAQSTGESLNDNQLSMDAAVRKVCPRLRALVATNSATQEEKDLFVRCNRVINASGGVDSQSPALQALTAEEANAAGTNVVEIGSASRSNVAGRLATLRNAGAGATTASLQQPGQLVFSTTGGASGDDGSFSEGRLGLFVQGAFGSGDKDPTRNEAGYDVDTFSVTGGIDYRFTDSLVAGAALGYAQTDSDFTRDSSGTRIGGSFDTDSLTLSLYGSWYGERSYVDLVASYGDIDYDSERRIVYSVSATPGQVGDVVLPATDSVNSTAHGKTSGDTLEVGLGAGVNFGNGPWRFGPLFAVNYLDLGVDGFSETGADELNLRYGDQSGESLQLQLGVDVAYTASLSRGVLVPYGSFVWISEQKDDQESFRLRYVSDPCARDGSGVTECSNFDVSSDKPDGNFYRWSVGLSAVFANGLAAFVDYTSIASLETISYGEATIGLRYQFR